MIQRLCDWLRWQFKIDWTLIGIQPTDYDGWLATPWRPYFWLIWHDERTGEVRIEPDV